MFKLPKKPAQTAQPEALTVRAALAETGWKSDAELMREAAERVLGTDPAKAAAQAAEDAALHVPVSMYPPGMFDAPPILESLRREVVKLQALVEAKSTPPAELAQPAASVKVGSARRPSDEDLLQELERRGGRETRGALRKTADHFGLDRSMVGKATLRAEQARIAKYGKNSVLPKDAQPSTWIVQMGKKVKTSPH
jgi:hypothetical protein